MKQMFALFALIIFVTAGCASQSLAHDRRPLPPVDTTNMESLGLLAPTFYWVALEKQHPGPKTEKVYGTNGELLTKISAQFMRHLKLEGTGLLRDGRLLNFAEFVANPDGTKDVRYRVCPKSAPYGYGYEGRKLRAFHSVAIDPNVVAMDSKIFIPAARGVVLPDGSIHDGYFDAVDIGDAIQNKRIDIFTAYGDQSAVFERAGLSNMRATEVFVVKNKEARE